MDKSPYICILAATNAHILFNVFIVWRRLIFLLSAMNKSKTVLSIKKKKKFLRFVQSLCSESNIFPIDLVNTALYCFIFLNEKLGTGPI